MNHEQVQTEFIMHLHVQAYTQLEIIQIQLDWIIMVGHCPFSIQTVAMFIHFSLLLDKMADRVQIIMYINNSQNYYSTTCSIVIVITATKAIVYR